MKFCEPASSNLLSKAYVSSLFSLKLPQELDRKSPVILTAAKGRNQGTFVLPTKCCKELNPIPSCCCLHGMAAWRIGEIAGEPATDPTFPVAHRPPLSRLQALLCAGALGSSCCKGTDAGNWLCCHVPNTNNLLSTFRQQILVILVLALHYAICRCLKFFVIITW